MASRANYDGPKRFYPLSQDVTARVSFGATGAPTLLPSQSRGIIGVTRQSTGLFTFQFGSKPNNVNKYDSYVWTENVEIQPDVSCTQNVAAAAAGMPAIYRDDIRSGLNALLVAPVQSNPSTASGGSLSGTSYYKVTAVDALGNESLPSNEKSISTSSKDTVNWAVVPGAVGYRVYYGTASNAENVVKTVAGGATTSLVVSTTTSAASGAVFPAIQSRPPIAACSVTVQLINSSGSATDPANGEIIRFTFTFIDTTAG